MGYLSDMIQQYKGNLKVYMSLLLLFGGLASQAIAQKNEAKDNADYLPVTFSAMPEDSLIEVKMGGEAFTAYRYASSIKKPILFPILSPDGTILTRGFPLEPRPGETVDHLHHTGHWLNYGVVNDVDFWTASAESEVPHDKKMGVVVHRQVLQQEEGKQGTLRILADWISQQQDTLLTEETTFTFAGTEHYRLIDRVTRLQAQQPTVRFTDSKEGMMAIRVARFLEQPSDTPQELIEASGRISKKKRVDNTGVHGEYRSSEGLKGDAVWGTRAPWVSLSSEKDGKQYAITIMDHPSNINFPTFWMARGYGLFAANPLGSAAYTEGKEQLNATLKKGETLTFVYRIMLEEGQTLSDDSVQRQYEDFKKAYPVP